MKHLILYISLFFCSITFAQSSLVEAKVDTTNIKIGEQFEYKISVNGTENVIIPKLELNSFEIIDSLKIDTLKNKLIKRYILTSFDSGASYIPQQQIFIKNQAYLTDSLLINIATVPIDTTKIKKFPIKGIKGEPYQFDDFRDYVFWGLLLLAIIVGLLVYYFVFYKKKDVEEKIIVPALPPYEEAIEKLKELDDKLLWQNNRTKQYYSELTEILRNYIGRDVEIPTLELTSNEIVELVETQNASKDLGISNDTINNIHRLLQSADLVKFAKSKPLANEIANDRKTVEQIINTIQPKVKTYRSIIEEQEGIVNDIEINTSYNDAIEITPKDHKLKTYFKTNFKAILIILLISLFIILGSYFGYKLYNSAGQFLDTTTTEQLYNKPWKTQSTAGNPIMTLETPVDLKKNKLPIEIAEDAKQFLKNVDTYSYASLVNNLQIAVSHFTYKEGLSLNLEGGIQEGIAQMQQQKGVSNIKYEVEPYSLNTSVEGAKLNGTLTENRIQKEFEALLFIHNHNAWMTIISHKINDTNGRQIVNRIKNSIKINIDDVE